MPVADRLEVLHADDRAEPARVHDRLDEASVRRVQQHMTDREDPLRSCGHLDDPPALLFGGRERLLEQYVISALEERDRGIDVETVLGGDDHGIGRPRAVQQFTPVVDELRAGQTVLAGDARPPHVVSLGDRHDPRAIRMVEHPARVVVAAVACTHDGEGDG